MLVLVLVWSASAAKSLNKFDVAPPAQVQVSGLTLLWGLLVGGERLGQVAGVGDMSFLATLL